MNIRAVTIVVLSCVSLATRAYSDNHGHNIDSLETIIRTDPPRDKADLIKIYRNLAWGYLETDEKASTKYANLGIRLAHEQKAYAALADFYRINGMHHLANARYEEAEKALLKTEEATKLMRKSGKYDAADIDNAESALFGTMGNFYNTLGNGAKALQYYHKALKIFKAHEWRESESLCYGNIAELYYCLGNLSHANEYYIKGDSIAAITNTPQIRYFCIKGQAKVAMQRGDYNRAWQIIERVWEYLDSHSEEEGFQQVKCLTVMTDIAFAEGNYRKAEELINKSIALGDSLHRSDANLYCQIAKLKAHNGDWNGAKEYALKALDIDIDVPDVAKGTFALLADIYSHLNQPDQAREYQKKADSIQTAWSNYAYQTSLAEQETIFNTAEKNSLISRLAAQRMYLLWGIGIVVVLLLVLGIVMLLIKQNHKRQKALLAAKVALEAESKERSLLAKDLHDGLGGMLSLLKLKLQNNEKEEAIRLLDDSVVEMCRLAHHLMPKELQKNGLITSLQDFAISVPGAQFNYFGDNRRLPRDLELIIYRCAYELVNNAIKHAAADRIDIQLMVDSEQAILTVSDNGQGMNVSEQATTGMGLQNIRDRIAEYDGRMDIISSPANGTEINVTLPLKDDIQD